jgi:hypothetical protein
MNALKALAKEAKEVSTRPSRAEPQEAGIAPMTLSAA